MTKVSKKISHQKMHLHTKPSADFLERSFTIIDQWLPKGYVALVQDRVDASAGGIRNVKYNRKGSLRIIKAMVEVALENKAFYESLENS